MRNKTRKKVGLFAFVCIGALVAALAAPAEITSSARGKGAFVFEGTRRTFAFNAVKDSFGNASGQGEIVRVLDGGSFTFHLKINCLSIAGNVATMSGTFSDNFGTLFIRGFPFWFQVADNGEGAGSPPDQITLVEFFFPPGDGVTCAEDRELPLIPIDSGNIQVK